MRISVAVIARAGIMLAGTTAAALTHPAHAQSDPSRPAPSSIADLRWSAPETRTGRYVIVSGEHGFVGGYATPGLEVWAYPLQIVRDYWISVRAEGDSTEYDGPTLLRSIEQTAASATRTYVGRDFTVRERIFVPVDRPASTITYSVESARPIAITVHFTPSLNLMWPAAIGGQELHWDAEHSAYRIDEPSHRVRGAIVSREMVAHDEWQNATRGAAFERPFTFTLRPQSSSTPAARVTFAGTIAPSDDPLAIADSLVAHVSEREQRARDRYAGIHVLDVETPDSAANRALRWAQLTLEQAWTCNPQLGCAMVAGFGPSRGERRPQYAWFFANDGLVAVDALLREGAYDRARDELAFIMQHQNARTGAIWHELSQSAGFLDWEHAYPYMFAHVDVSFDFINTVRDYVRTTGDVDFARAHWRSIRAAFDYCRATIPRGGRLPEIPEGQQGRDEQDPQRDELSLSLAWVSAAASFAELAAVTGHAALAAEARKAGDLARAAIRPAYRDPRHGTWASGHLRSGAPVEGLTGGLIALLRAGMLDDAEQRALLDQLASPAYRAAWGIRSTPSDSPVYDPDAYARGSVWAIGTADALMAFYDAGRADVATSLWRDLVPWFSLDALGHAHEVLRGDAFAPERESVPDQTWSSAAFVASAVRGLLGLQVDGVQREIRFAPRLPAGWDSVRVRHVAIEGGDVSLALQRSSDVVTLDVDNAGPALTLRFVSPLPEGTGVQQVDVSSGAHLIATAPTPRTREVTIAVPANQRSRVSMRLTREP